MVKQQFKQSQLYGWEEEPVDERPSEFMSSTGFATLSGYHPMMDPMRRARPRSRFGVGSMLVVVILFIALGGWAIIKIAPMLRH
jgi:hypothetical protein